LLERENVLGLHHEVLDHGWRAATDKAGHGVEVLDKIRWDALIGGTGGPAPVEIIVGGGSTAAGLGGHVHLGRGVRLDLEDAKPGRVGDGGGGRARGLFAVTLPLAVATAAGSAGFDVVLETHVFGESVRAREGLVTLGELAGEGFLARVGSEVGDKCEARSLREATTGARGPFTSVVGFVHAYVIFMEVAYERVQVVKGSPTVFPLTGDDVRRRAGIGWLRAACGRAGARSSCLGGIVRIGEC